MGHAGSTGLVVPDNAPQQPQIAGGDAVVVVQIQRKQGAYIHPENGLRVDALRQQSRVQAVKSLHQNDGIHL